MLPLVRTAIRVPSGDQAKFPAQSKCRLDRYRVRGVIAGERTEPERRHEPLFDDVEHTAAVRLVQQ